jgi:cell wall-associated NlpC family hydrolase
MSTAIRRAASLAALSTVLALIALAAVAAMPGARAWAANARGGISVQLPEPKPGPSPTTPAGRAIISAGRAIAPVDAPAAVKKVIAAANRIRSKPYVWGGGHGHWWDRGYDCSGAVSFALHGGALLSSPLPSGPMERWGNPGPGRWITVYANAAHAYAVIAGLRWDTAGNTTGTGPRWHESLAAAATGPFVPRHPIGY